jgi:hypothetical protein
MMNGSIWKYTTIGTCTLLASIMFLWINSVSSAQEEASAATVENSRAIEILAENQRNIHFEKEVDRGILNRIDLNTGGPGDAPDVRPLREK